MRARRSRLREGRKPRSSLAVGALLALQMVASGAAAETPCPSLAVESDAAVSARWPGLAARVGRRFADRADIDTCARVRLALRGSALEVQVTLQDGRSAARVVDRPADLEASLAALLLVPEPSAATVVHADVEPAAATALPAAAPPLPPAPPRSPPGSAAPPRPAPVATIARRDAREPLADSAVPAPEASAVGLEFSLFTGARVSADAISAGLGMLSALELASWLIGCEGRFESYSPTGADEGIDSTLSLALLGGYRVPLGSTGLDLTAGPALAIITGQTISLQALDAERVPRVPPAESAKVAPRLAAAAHYRFRLPSQLRAFIGIDGQLGPAPAGTSGQIAELPAWTAGLVLGATVATR